MSILCIMGLGNPGPRFIGTRHNAGTALVELMAEKVRRSFRRPLFAPFEEISLTTEHLHQTIQVVEEDESSNSPRYKKILLVKPRSYMNSSGECIPAILRRHGKNIHFVVAVDQMDIPPGQLRLKTRGGTAGHNGLKSVSAYIDKDFWPLYIGIGRPPAGIEVIQYVLARPEPSQQKLLEASLERLMVQLFRMPFRPEGEVLGEINRRSASMPDD